MMPAGITVDVGVAALDPPTGSLARRRSDETQGFHRAGLSRMPSAVVSPSPRMTC